MSTSEEIGRLTGAGLWSFVTSHPEDLTSRDSVFEEGREEIPFFV